MANRPSGMTPAPPRLAPVLLAHWALVAALALFTVGFLPAKNPLPGSAVPEDIPDWPGGQRNGTKSIRSVCLSACLSKP